MTSTLLLICSPLLLLALYVLVRAVVRRPVSRRALNVIVALMLLAYVMTTAALGLFWVARMDLPAFDLHYSFGYAMLALLGAHLVLQLKPLAVFFRRVSPKRFLDASGTRFSPFARGLGVTLLCLAVVGPLLTAFVLGRFGGTHRVTVTAQPPDETRDQARPGRSVVWIERDGTRVSAHDYLYEQSSYTRAGLLRSPGIPRQRPPETRSIPGAEVLTLPPPSLRGERSLGSVMATRPDESDGDGARIIVERAPTGGISQAMLADVLAHAAGITNERSAALKLRAAPSAGALYPTDLYVVSRRAGDLTDGVRYYDPHAHVLRSVSGAEAANAVFDAVPTDSPVKGAPLVFVLSATWDRTVFKYDVRSYRYVTLDAGHLAGQLVLAATARSLRCSLEGRFDDAKVATSLELEADDDGALLLVACRPGASSTPETKPLTSPANEPVGLPDRAEELELTRLSHALTSWRLTEGQALAIDPSPRAPASTTPRRLPIVSAPEADVFETIAKRRSVREFSRERPLSLEELAGILADSGSRPPRVRGVPLVELYVLVSRVSGLDPGAYRYVPEQHALEPKEKGDPSARIQSAGLSQEVLGRGAIVLVWTLNESTLGRTDGARDFRSAGLDAGLGGAHAYLSATARGLGACGVGAYYDEEVATLLDTSVSLRPLYLLSIGHM